MIKPDKHIIADREGFPSAEQAVSFRQFVPFYPEQLYKLISVLGEVGKIRTAALYGLCRRTVVVLITIREIS